MKLNIILLIAVLATAVSAGVIERQAKPPTLIEALNASFQQIFNNVIGPAINTQIQNLANLGAQLLAGASQGSILDLLGIGKRDVEKGITDFLTQLGQSVLQNHGATIDALLQGWSLTLAQNLAVIAAGKRDLDEKAFLDSVTSAFTQIFNEVFLPAINTQIQGLANIGAQVLAGASQESIVGMLTGLLGKRDLEKGFWDELGASLLSSLTPAIDHTLQSLSLTAAQILAQIANGGSLSSIIGKRELKGFFDDLLNSLKPILDQVIMPAVNTQIQGLANIGAQVLAGASQESIVGMLTNLIGKRDLEKGFWEDLGNQLLGAVVPTVDQFLQSLSLTGAQLLAGIAQNGIGKRELKGFLDSLTSALNQILNQVIMPAVNTQIQGLANIGAQVLAGASQESIVGMITNLVGKRNLEKGFWEDLGNQILATILPTVDQALQSLSLTGAQLLAGIAQNGIGKRELKGFFDDLLNSLKPQIDSILQALAIQGAQSLAQIANGNLNLIDTILG